MATLSTSPLVEIVVTLAPRPVNGVQVRGVPSVTAAVDALLSRDVLGALGLDVLCVEGIEPCELPALTETGPNAGHNAMAGGSESRS
jgi:hypothetical protein